LKKIFDPLYGLIELNDIENLIIDTPLFQRLRYIKQLGLSHYVYPTANHTRFTHSLGVFHITAKICSILQQQNSNLFNDYIIKNLKMAALLHDIGHFPFSHVLEFNNNDNNFNKLPDFFKKTHEELGIYIINNSYIKDILKKDSDYNIDLINNLIIGNDIAYNQILNKIINWELDADRLDYLLRDSFFSGIKYGPIDLNYLINNYRIYKEKKLVINEKASRSIENLLIARFSLYDRLYTHKTSCFFEFLLKKISKFLLIDNLYPSFITLKEFKEIIQTEDDSKRLFELTDKVLFNNLFKKYLELKKERSKNIKLLRDFETILFRKKTYEVKYYQIITSYDMGLIESVIFKIQKEIENLINEYDDEIFIDIPQNKFTDYKSIFYPAMGLDDEKIQEIKEQEMKSIWILTKNDELKLFYEWEGTYFRQLRSFKNIKFLAFLNRTNKKLIENFDPYNKKIKERLSKLK